MRWSNVLLIFRREVRDQLRDRRTLFMIFVLPILLYPILGIGIVQFSAAFEQKPRTVVVVGAEYLPETPPLLNPRRDGFDPALFDSDREATLLQVRREPDEGKWADPAHRERAIRTGEADAVVTIPRDVRRQLDGVAAARLPIVYDSTDESSQITYLRLKEVLSRWKEKVVAERLIKDHKPPSYTEPIKVAVTNVAPDAKRGVSVWARLFPFLLVMMSLTGAFYPAVDLCAGEKERGTMETLLISPAARSEIVIGKFLTVVLASMMTALLNLVSMGLTGMQLARKVGALSPEPQRLDSVIAPPTLMSAFWMLLLLIPLSVFFSAICLALAVLARSMKEGQYYMTPLYLVCLPLIFLTLAPGVELNLFYSLVPITGVSLLLRALILGDYNVAWRYFLPVLIPTIIYGGVALRWAVEQFQREDVLFREAERFDLRTWVKHLLRDKEPLPSGGEALLCFALMLTLAWFLIQLLAVQGLADSARGMVLGQVAFILLPPVVMAVLLTSDPRRTLRLDWPKTRYLLLAAGLALALNPLVNELRPIVELFFPIPRTVKALLETLMRRPHSLAESLVIFALVPAVCEEIAFRGFILSGLEHGHDRRSAIFLSALLFGFLHVLLSLFQQLFNATLLGLVLGLLAIRSQSIVPGILFHFLNNGLAVALGSWVADPRGGRVAAWLYREPAQGLYHRWWVVLGALASCMMLAWLVRGEGRKRRADRLHAEIEANPLLDVG
jgi:sodium transport system permease protein